MSEHNSTLPAKASREPSSKDWHHDAHEWQADRPRQRRAERMFAAVSATVLTALVIVGLQGLAGHYAAGSEAQITAESRA